MNVLKKLERNQAFYYQCYLLSVQCTLKNLNERFSGFHSYHRISFKMEPLGETFLD